MQLPSVCDDHFIIRTLCEKYGQSDWMFGIEFREKIHLKTFKNE